MPVYLYRCECDSTQVVSHSISEDPDVRCSSCNLTMFRQPQLTEVSFKGTGWGHE